MPKAKTALTRRAVERQGPSSSSPTPPPAISYPDVRLPPPEGGCVTGWELVHHAMQQCYRARTERGARVERRVVLDLYGEAFDQSPPDGMEWELVRARIYTALQHHGHKLAGLEGTLSQEFLQNLRAAWHADAERNHVSGWSADVGSTFMFLYERKKEERAMATKQTKAAKAAVAVEAAPAKKVLALKPKAAAPAKAAAPKAPAKVKASVKPEAQRATRGSDALFGFCAVPTIRKLKQAGADNAKVLAIFKKLRVQVGESTVRSISPNYKPETAAGLSPAQVKQLLNVVKG